MRISFLTRLGALAVLAFASGCSSGQLSSNLASGKPAALGHLNYSDLGHIQPNNTFFTHLYVTDQADKIGVLDTSYNWLNDITNGTPCPSGAWSTRSGPHRLYVANFGCNGPPEVSEYKALTTAPYGTLDYTYTTSLVDPVSVTTDSNSNVYVADLLGAQVVEFAQHTNAVLNHCPGGATGVAVDNNGNVYAMRPQPMQVVEYPGPAGLANCSAAVTLPVTFPSGAAGGELLYYFNNPNYNLLLACDQHDGIYAFAPTQSTPALIQNSNVWGNCLHMGLNQGSAGWLVITYPYQAQPHLVVTRPFGNIHFYVYPTPGNHNINPVGVAVYPG